MLFFKRIEEEIDIINNELSINSAHIVTVQNNKIDITYRWASSEKGAAKNIEWLKGYTEKDFTTDFIIIKNKDAARRPILLVSLIWESSSKSYLILGISPSFSPDKTSLSFLYHLLKIKLLFKDFFYELKIKGKELLQKEILNVIPLSVFISDLSGQINFANKEAIKLLGYSYKEIISKNIFKLSSDNLYNEKNWQLMEARQSEQLLLGTNLKKSNKETVAIDAVTHFISEQNQDYFISFVRKIEDTKQEKAIFQKVMEAQNTERKRFAKDLHDGLGPLLSLIKLYISDLNSDDISLGEQNELIHDIIKLIDDAILSAKRIANNLVPSVLKEYGLINAIENFIKQINKNEHIDINLDINGKNEFQLNVQMELYQIVRELLNNALKHSEAKKVELKFEFSQNHLTLRYCDDGKGFDYNGLKELNLGMGLDNLNSRVEVLNGVIKFESRIGKGTKILIDI